MYVPAANLGMLPVRGQLAIPLLLVQLFDKLPSERSREHKKAVLSSGERDLVVAIERFNDGARQGMGLSRG